MKDLRVLDDPAAVEVALDPIRAAILDALSEPASASMVAAEIGSTRQKVNYHLKTLEEHGLVELTEERSWGGITERVFRRSAERFVVSPEVMDRDSIDPTRVDSLSAAYLIAVNARSVSELGSIVASADTKIRVPTLTIDTVIGFRSAQDRANFSAELQATIAGLVARYHHDDGRPHRLIVSSYPRPKESK